MLDMKKFFWLATVLLCASGAFAQIKVQPIDLKERKLSNGLRVVTVQDNSNPTVSIHV